jgi:steroid 5-alpha reductase family enzyme
MSFFTILFTAGSILLVLMTVLWVFSLLIRDSSIVDIFWGLSFIVLSSVYFINTPGGIYSRRLLVWLLVFVWGVRLAGYIFWRNWGKGEDFRYRKWRQQHGSRWWLRSYFQVFLLQGLLAWLLSTPLLAAMLSPTPPALSVSDYVGGLIWLLGFAFESTADWQLAAFKRDPSNFGKVLQSGLWRYTRHPNYFGEALLWWGFGILGLNNPNGWWTLYSPMLMSYLLVNVSGVRLLETSMQEKHTAYQEYIRTTSPFFPMPPRSPKNKNSTDKPSLR